MESMIRDISTLFLFLSLFNCSESDSNFQNLSGVHPTIQGFTDPSANNYDDINSNKEKTEILNRIFGEHYDTTVRPRGINGSGPTIVYISVFLRSIDNIDDVKMEYAMQMTFRQEWNDARLKYSPIQKNIKYLHLSGWNNRIWVPDLYFVNEKKAVLHELVVPNLFTRIYPNGTVLQSYRINLLLSCIFNLRQFPLDVQSCPIEIGSYGWTTDGLDLVWRKYEAINFEKDFQLARFKLVDTIFSENCEYVTWTGRYSCVRLNLSFEREIGFYLIQMYIPCGMLVIVSWLSFWLEPTAVEARVSLGVTSILTIVTQTYGINQSAPPTSYVKVLDIWTAFCQAMMFGALLEFALVNYITNSKFFKGKKVYGLGGGGTTARSHQALEAKFIENCRERAKRIDLASRVIFPCIFLLFNIAYWTALLNNHLKK